MLAVGKYKKAHIEACRRQVDAAVATYKKALGGKGGAFEAHFVKHMILALDRYFVHRTRGMEGKDGNALNEVRMLCASISEAGDKLLADTTIKYDAAKSATKLAIGDKLDLTIDQFEKLSAAFFAELTKRFS